MSVHRIVLTGGGTGGHIYPALAVYDYLKDDPEVADVLYIGAGGHLEEKLAAERELKFVGLSVSGFPRKASPELIPWTFEFIVAVMEARRALAEFRPTAVLGTGGYASAPALAAALTLGIPYGLHEPDAHPGLVNRVFGRWANLVSLGMDGAVESFQKSRGKVIVNGNPVGKRFDKLLKRDSACAVLGLNDQLKTVLITGGSQGARAINEAVMAALPALLAVEPAIQVVHQAGHKNIQEYRDRLPKEISANPHYVLRDYFDDLSLVYAFTDLAVCRAGAMTIAEMAVCGVPALFIPLPSAAADHQTHNAQYLAAKQASEVLPQSRLSGESLKEAILSLLADGERLKLMHEHMTAMGKPSAASDLADQIKEMSVSHQMRRASNVPETGL